jgi:hypothetical protein
MTLIPLAPPPGLDSDETAFRAQGRWADGNNVRFYNGAPQSIGAYSSTITLTASQSVVGIAVVGGPIGGAYTIIGTGDKLWAGANLTGVSDVTPASLPTGNTSWSFASYGNTVMCSPFDGEIYQYTLGGGAAVALSGDPHIPARNHCVLVARRQVLAFGCNEELSGTFNGRCIRGSDIEDPTNWTTSATNNVFEYVLDDDGIILAARALGDYIAVWTSTSLWLATYLGDPGQTYQFEKISGAAGTMGPNTACVVGQVATWLGADLQLWQWTPGAPPTPVACPISIEFKANFDSADFARVASITYFNEIWLFYIDSRDGATAPSRYIAFNQQGQWFRGQLARDTVAASGIISAILGGRGFLAAKDNIVYSHDLSSGTFPTWSITSADQYIDNGGRRTMITRFIPDFQGQGGNISLTLAMKNGPQSAAVTKGPYTIAAADRKKDFRASGMIVSATFSGSSFARFGKPSFDVTPMGER